MSVPPDFMTRLMAGLQGGMNNPLLQTGLGIMSAAGPSRMPVSLGNALTGGIQQGNEMRSAQLQQMMQQLMLGKTGMQMNLLQNALAPDQNQPTQQPAQQSTQQDLQPPTVPPGNPFSPASLQALSANQAPTSAPAIPMQTQPLQTSTDPYQDKIYLHNQKIAQVMDMMQPGSGAGYAAAASQRIEYLTKNRPGLWETVDTSDYKKYGLPAQEPGVTWQRNTQTGEVKPAGEKTIIPISGPGPNGQYQQGYYDAATKQTVWPANNAGSNRQAGTPLQGANETYADQVANYEVAPPSPGGRNAAWATNILARAQEKNPDFNAQNYDASKKAYEAFSSGKPAQTVKSYSVFLDHVQTLKQLATALNNGDVKAVNYLKNQLASATGHPEITSFQTAMPIVADEGVKAIIGAGGGVGDRELAQSVFSPSNSPQQFLGSVGALEKLGAGQLGGLGRQYSQSTYRKDFEKWLSPAAKQLYESNQTQEAGNNGLPAGWTVQVH